MTTQAALLGCDHPHSGAHLQTLETMPEVSGIHLWDPAPAAAEALKAKYPDTPITVHADLDGLLSDDQVPWLTVSLRNDVAPEILLRCAAAGRPVMAEKPIGRSYAETAAVVEAFRAKGLALGICFQNRYKPAVQTVRQWVAEGLFGRLCAVETRLHTTQVKLRDPGHWLFQQSLSGGGILPWLGCHYLDLLRYVTGAEPVSVTAQCATLSGEAIDVEDMAVLTLAFDNGALATASFGYVMAGGRPGYITPGYDTYFALKGTTGQVSFEIAAGEPTVQALSLERAWLGAPQRRLTFREEEARAYGNRYGLEFARDCLRAGLEGAAPPASGDDLLAVWAMIEAAYRSQREGVRVELSRSPAAGERVV